MAVLEKIRVKMGLFITVIIGLALLSFIIDADTFNRALALFSNKYDVGEMNGKAISYQDFQKKIDYYNQIHQLVTGSASTDQESSDMINNSAWQELVSENVILPTITKAGIKVEAAELVELTRGVNISPVLAREPIFMDENGMFNRDALVEFVSAIKDDPSGNLQTYWNYLENNMYMDRMLSKYATLLEKSSFETPVELRRTIDENNITADLSFVVQPYGFERDTSVVVSRQEVREYYNANKVRFEQEASRDIEYVLFEVTPSSEDIRLAEQQIESLMEEFSTTSTVRGFINRNSDVPFSSYFYAKGELEYLSEELETFAFEGKVGDVFPIFKDDESFKAARIVEKKRLPDSVFVQHILIQDYDRSAAEATVDSLMALLKGGANFATIAEENSFDRNPNVEQPGDLGWMTQQNRIEGFDTCFVLTPGTLAKVETTYGNHIVKVSKRTPLMEKVQLAILEKEIISGRETFQKSYQEANEIATKADGNIEKFNEAIQEAGLYALPAYNIAEGARTFGSYENVREIVRWAYDSKVGDVSQIISIDNKYFFVVALTDVRESGVAPLEQVEDEISTTLMAEKSHINRCASVAKEIEGLNDLEEIAEKLGTTVSSQSGLSFGSLGSRSFDPKFIGAVAAAEEGKLVGPIVGSIGVYIFKIESRDVGAFFTEEDAKQRSDQYKYFQLQALPTLFNELGKVKDYRAKFF